MLWELRQSQSQSRHVTVIPSAGAGVEAGAGAGAGAGACADDQTAVYASTAGVLVDSGHPRFDRGTPGQAVLLSRLGRAAV